MLTGIKPGLRNCETKLLLMMIYCVVATLIVYDMISVLYNDVISACIAASDHIPTTTWGGGVKRLNLDETKM